MPFDLLKNNGRAAHVLPSSELAGISSLGYKSNITTQRYITINDDVKRRAMELV